MSGLPVDQAERERIVALLNIGALLSVRPDTSQAASASAWRLPAVLMKPRLLLLDEPLASLGPGAEARNPAVSGAAA